jgi:anthranilate synthase component 1
LLAAEMKGYHPVSLPGLPRFTGGAVGFVGYEYLSRIEPTVPVAKRDELGVPLLYFMLSDSLLIFDRAKQTLRLCVNAHIRGRRRGGLRCGRGRIAHPLRPCSSKPRELAPAPLVEPAKVEVPPGNFTREPV